MNQRPISGHQKWKQTEALKEEAAARSTSTRGEIKRQQDTQQRRQQQPTTTNSSSPAYRMVFSASRGRWLEVSGGELEHLVAVPPQRTRTHHAIPAHKLNSR